MKISSLARLVAATVTVAAMGLPVLSASADGSVTQTYYGPVSDLGVNVCRYQGQELNIGAACFRVGRGTLDITVKDATGQPTPVGAFFRDAGAGNVPPTDWVIFCGKVAGVKVPDNAVWMIVGIGVAETDRNAAIPLTGKLACGTPGPASTGTITVSGSGVQSVPARSVAATSTQVAKTSTAAPFFSKAPVQSAAITAVTRAFGHLRLL